MPLPHAPSTSSPPLPLREKFPNTYKLDCKYTCKPTHTTPRFPSPPPPLVFFRKNFQILISRLTITYNSTYNKTYNSAYKPFLLSRHTASRASRSMLNVRKEKGVITKKEKGIIVS